MPTSFPQEISNKYFDRLSWDDLPQFLLIQGRTDISRELFKKASAVVSHHLTRRARVKDINFSITTSDSRSPLTSTRSQQAFKVAIPITDKKMLSMKTYLIRDDCGLIVETTTDVTLLDEGVPQETWWEVCMTPEATSVFYYAGDSDDRVCHWLMGNCAMDGETPCDWSCPCRLHLKPRSAHSILDRGTNVVNLAL